MLMRDYASYTFKLTRGTIITIEAFYDEDTKRNSKFHFY